MKSIRKIAESHVASLPVVEEGCVRFTPSPIERIIDEDLAPDEQYGLASPEMAVELYLVEYFEQPGFDELPADLQEKMFEAALAVGPVRAIIQLQKTLNAYAPLRMIDGVIGRRTATAAAKALETAGRERVLADLNKNLKALVAAITKQNIEAMTGEDLGLVNV